MLPNPDRSTRLTVAFIAGQLGLGGAEQQLYHLVSGLDRATFSPLVISLAARRGEFWEEPIERAGVPIVHVARAAGRAGRVMQIARILRSAHVDVVHAWAFHTNPYAALAGRLGGAPIRVGSMRESYSGLPANRLWRWLGVRGLDRLVTNSRVNADTLRRHMPSPDRVHVVPNGVTLPSDADAIERHALKAELGLDSSCRIVGTVGRLDRNKNHLLLLRAFARIEARRPRAHLVIIGDGPLRDELVDEASRLGVQSQVHLTGALPGAARYVPAFDVCCLTSNTEGMPNLLMEASAAGVPCIATDCGGTRDVIDHGVTGYLVRPGDEADVSEHLERLLDSADHARHLGQAGRARMQREFAVATMVARMSDIYLSEVTKRFPAHVHPGAAHGIS